MVTQMSTHTQELRTEFEAQKGTGIGSYSRWLEQRSLKQERELNMQSMGDEVNHQLWKQAQAENERLAAALDYVRDWLEDMGYSRAVRVLDEQVK